LSITAESILASVVRITEQRSQQHLENCLVGTLASLADLSYCGISRPITTTQGTLIERLAEVADGNAVPSMPPVNLADLPLVARALRSGKAETETAPDGRVCRCMPILDDSGEILAFLETCVAAGKAEPLVLCQGFASIYRNYLSILRDAACDTLTGLKNRKTFDENFNRIVATSRHLEMPFDGNRRVTPSGEYHWLGMVDIDHFKRINDNFGHVFGDEVLLLLAAVMRKTFRGEDLLFRFGGEEFVVMLAPTTFASASAVFERFRRTVEEYNFPQVGRVTTSVGFVRIHPGDLPSVVIGHADEALYYAKRHGRNQVRSYEQLVESGGLKDDTPDEGGIELF
jgi:diguanylate cyclase (GGDEF)-like protein